MANVPTQFLKVAGKFGSYGEDGKPGVTFTPSVSEDGTLTWTNDGGLENPAPVTIKGTAGSGVHIGAEEPTDPNTNVWIDTDEEVSDEETDFIPVPETAEVGQTIIVKSIDENGKPTEWETADFNSNVGYLQLVNVTTEQDVSDLIITKCDDGETFSDKNITEITIRCEVAPNTSIADYKNLILIFKPNGPMYGYITLNQAMYITKRHFVATLKAAGFIEAHYGVFGDGTGKILFTPSPHFMTTNFDKIEGVHLRSGDSVIPSGTKIIIMGR